MIVMKQTHSLSIPSGSEPSSQIAKVPKLISIRYRSHAKVSDRYLINVDPRVFIISASLFSPSLLNILKYEQNGPHFADDNFKCIFMNENI